MDGDHLNNSKVNQEEVATTYALYRPFNFYYKLLLKTMSNSFLFHFFKIDYLRIYSGPLYYP